MPEPGSRYSEADLLPLSGLQHLVFCERQAALIHVERLWVDNRLTIEGSHMHRRVDEAGPRRERRGDLIIDRGLPLRSLDLGLAGRADVVEFHLAPSHEREAECGLLEAISLRGVSGRWVPFPIDYKRGNQKVGRCDEVQLCAQAMCLEEMLRVCVPEGALFYGKPQRRHAVRFDAPLRSATAAAALRFHELFRRGETPRAEWSEGCVRCSLLDVCLPGIHRRGRSVQSYMTEEIFSPARRDGSDP